jgi:hypothetical protein
VDIGVCVDKDSFILKPTLAGRVLSAKILRTELSIHLGK